MKKAILIRTKDDGHQTEGKLMVYDEDNIIFSCAAIEPPWKENRRLVSCIPPGTYIVKKRYSPRHKHHFHIQDVPGRTWILIHAGNFRRNTTGCILVGKFYVRDIDGDGLFDLSYSFDTLQYLLGWLPEEFFMEIKYA